MDILQWAAKHNISSQALIDLSNVGLTSLDDTHLSCAEPKSEASVQNQIRIEASQKGCRLWRNNVGACTDDHGNFIRYGLANESTVMNKHIKSSDLIGIRPILVTPDLVGRVIGQFMAREVKRSGWRFTGNKREKAQLNFLNIVNNMGGDGAFTNGEGGI